MIVYVIYVIFLVLINAFAFFAYWADKRKAQIGRWRIKESFLLGLGIWGGAVGALLSMNLFRHKTKHWYFWAVNGAALVVHAALFIVLTVYVI